MKKKNPAPNGTQTQRLAILLHFLRRSRCCEWGTDDKRGGVILGGRRQCQVAVICFLQEYTPKQNTYASQSLRNSFVFLYNTKYKLRLKPLNNKYLYRVTELSSLQLSTLLRVWTPFAMTSESFFVTGRERVNLLNPKQFSVVYEVRTQASNRKFFIIQSVWK